MGETHATKLARIETENAHTNQELARVRQKMDNIQNSVDDLKDAIRDGFQKMNERADKADTDREALQKDVADMKPEIKIIRDGMTFYKISKRVGAAIIGSGVVGALYAKWELLQYVWRK